VNLINAKLSEIDSYCVDSLSIHLSLTHNSSQDFSGTGSGSASTTETLGTYSFRISLEQL
jgi:hypothetical protein